MKIKVRLLLTMLLLSIIYGLINHLIIIPVFDNQLVHCLILSLGFGFINYFVITAFIQKSNRLESANIKLEAAINIDKLTGLLNRRAFDKDISTLNKFDEYSILFIDIDDFKKFNDDFGHEIGDEVLCLVSEDIRRAIRSEDKIYRYGGEEIVVFLTECNQINATLIAEKLRKEVVQMKNSDLTPITISLGIATYPINGQTSQEILHKADKALLSAKRAGKNRTEVFDH